MASGGLARDNFGQGRFGRTADIHHLWTPRMERASGRNVECAGYLAACAQVVIAENPFGITQMAANIARTDKSKRTSIYSSLDA